MSEIATGRTGRAGAMDVHVGARIKLRRTQMGLSLQKLGDAISVPFQQIQKYEFGVNRVGASRLFDLSVALNVPVDFFYDDMPVLLAAERGGEPSAQAARRERGFSAPAQADFADGPTFAGRSMAAELVDAFERIDDPVARRSLLEMAKSMVGILHRNG